MLPIREQPWKDPSWIDLKNYFWWLYFEILKCITLLVGDSWKGTSRKRTLLSTLLHHCIMTLPFAEHLHLFLFFSAGTPSIRSQSLLPFCNSSSKSSWFFWLFFICHCSIALSASKLVILFSHFVRPVVFLFHFSLL